MPILSRGTEELPCKLTPEELEAKGQELAAVCAEIDGVEAEKKVAAARFKNQIDELEAKRADLYRVVQAKAEHRTVEVEHLLILDDGMVRTIRKDNGDVVRQRVATSQECNSVQPNLLDTPAGTEPPAAPAPDAEPEGQVGPDGEQ